MEQREGAYARRRCLIKLIASSDGAHISSQFLVRGDVLCASPVLKDYVELPDTVPPEVRRNGEGTLTFNADAVAMRVVVEHLKEKLGAYDFVLQRSEREAVFYLRLYKIALCLGLHDLCTTTLLDLQATTKTADQFFKVAIEASDTKLIEEPNFRNWFVDHIRNKHERLLTSLEIDDNAARLCSILVSAVALTPEIAPPSTPKFGSRPPPTPPTSGPRAQANPFQFDGASSPRDDKQEESTPKRARREQRKTATNPAKTKSTPQHAPKKRKFQAKVEEVPDADVFG